MIKNNLKIAWRNLIKNKVSSLINIGGLAVGMAVVMLIGLWIYDELSFDKYHKNYNRIAQVIQNVTNNGEVQTWLQVPYPLAAELRKSYGSDFKACGNVCGAGDHIVHLVIKNSPNGYLYGAGGTGNVFAANAQRQPERVERSCHR